MSVFVDRASSQVILFQQKKPQVSQNLRWVRKTRKNKQILMDFLIKRFILKKVIHHQGCSYLPCCNVFSNTKPTGRGHHEAMSNPLNFLLEENEVTRILTFRQNFKISHHSLSPIDFNRLVKTKLFSFIKSQLELKKLSNFIDGLPNYQGCFQLPLNKAKYAEDCPGLCPLAKFNKKLIFKVDLVAPLPKKKKSTESPSPQSGSKKRRNQAEKPSEKSFKKLKLRLGSMVEKQRKQNTSKKDHSQKPKDGHFSLSSWIVKDKRPENPYPQNAVNKSKTSVTPLKFFKGLTKKTVSRPQKLFINYPESISSSSSNSGNEERSGDKKGVRSVMNSPKTDSEEESIRRLFKEFIDLDLSSQKDKKAAHSAMKEEDQIHQVLSFEEESITRIDADFERKKIKKQSRLGELILLKQQNEKEHRSLCKKILENGQKREVISEEYDEILNWLSENVKEDDPNCSQIQKF